MGEYANEIRKGNKLKRGIVNEWVSSVGKWSSVCWGAPEKLCRIHLRTDPCRVQGS